ncbi:MAG: hypothetical protein H8E66_31730 [Planctomycetes bacterium]|nr:hypothetical protein [Planctomycetota bacterium]
MNRHPELRNVGQTAGCLGTGEKGIACRPKKPDNTKFVLVSIYQVITP